GMWWGGVVAGAGRLASGHAGRGGGGGGAARESPVVERGPGSDSGMGCTEGGSWNKSAGLQTSYSRWSRRRSGAARELSIVDRELGSDSGMGCTEGLVGSRSVAFLEGNTGNLGQDVARGTRPILHIICMLPGVKRGTQSRTRT